MLIKNHKPTAFSSIGILSAIFLFSFISPAQAIVQPENLGKDLPAGTKILKQFEVNDLKNVPDLPKISGRLVKMEKSVFRGKVVS